MSWSEFTKNHIKLLKKYKYNLDENNSLLLQIKNERDRVKNFINNYLNLEYKLTKVTDETEVKSIINKIHLYADVSWVDKKEVINQLDFLTDTLLISWESVNETKSNKNNNLNKLIVKIKKSNIKSFIENLKILILMIEYLKNKSNNEIKIMEIYLVLTNLTKEFPKGETIGIKNANTGYTDFSKNIIFIWRWEEYIKVLFHEITHYLDMDSRDEHVHSIIHSYGPHSYFEAITDFKGINYNLIYLSLITRKPIKLLLELELGFIRNQAMILNKYFDLGNNWQDYVDKQIKQNTPAFSYYILKYLIYSHALENKILDPIDYNSLVHQVINKGFQFKPYVNIKSSRMTMLQLE